MGTQRNRATLTLTQISDHTFIVIPRSRALGELRSGNTHRAIAGLFPSEIDSRTAGAGVEDEAERPLTVKHYAQHDLVVKKIERYLEIGLLR